MRVVPRSTARLLGVLLPALLAGVLGVPAAAPANAPANAPLALRHAQRCHPYRLTDLGVLGGEDSRAYAVSSNGYVAGLGDAAPGSGWRAFHAFRWTPRHRFAVAGRLADLGTLGSDLSSGAFGVNRTGLTVGVSLSSDGGSVAFVARRRMRQLRGLGHGLSDAQDVDNRGRIVGSARADDGRDHAVLWVRHRHGFRVVDLGVPPGRVGSSAMAISRYGQVAGAVSDPDYYGFAALWTPHRRHGTTGTWRELGVLPGGSGSVARDVNRRGVVVGEGDSAQGDRGWLFDTRMRVLPPLPHGTTSIAFAVNDHGLVVGWSNARRWAGDRAVVWRGPRHRVLDLNACLPRWAKRAGIVLRGAYDVNNRGQVVGVAGVPTSNGEHAHAFLLTPRPTRR
jgi:uncharacterized membrane protein